MGIGSSVKSDIASQKDPERINVLFVCGEWNSSKGGLATFNREAAINLAKTASDKIKVFCYVSQSKKVERKDAEEHGVHMITAKGIPGTSDPLEWLRIPPQQLLHPDVVVGHGLKFGIPACCIARATSCKWVHVVHVLYEDLGKYKLTDEMGVSSSDTIEENEKKHKEEIKLCKEANAVIAVGSWLQHRYHEYLPGIEVDVITPGVLKKFCQLSDQKKMHSSDEFSIFVFGRASFEDLALKGYDIIADAVGSLGQKFSITFVGAPEGQHRNMEDWFLQKTRITRRQLTIRGYCNQEELKGMFFAADMVAMPSRTEGFGLVALEAMSAGIPIIVTRESGIANALDIVEGGKSVIVESEKAEEWAQKIKMLSEETPEERHKSAISLRENYNSRYSWSSQCQRFKEKLVFFMNESCPANQVNAVVHATRTSDDSSSNSVRSTKTASEAPQRDTLRSGAVDLSAGQDSSSNRLPSVKTVSQAPQHTLTSGAVVHGTSDDSTSKPSVNAVSEAPRGTLRSGGSTEDSSAKHANSIEKSKQLRGNGDSTLLHSAAESGNVDTIKKVLSLGLDIDSRNTKGNTPLMIAAFTGQPDVFHFLLERGSDPTLKDNDGWSLLHHAARGGCKGIIEKLLSLELDADSGKNDGLTPLMIAASAGQPDAFHFLLGRGSDHTLKDNNDRGPLHYAAEGGHKVIIEQLLSLGLDGDSMDRAGETPLMMSLRLGKTVALKYLFSKGARS